MLCHHIDERLDCSTQGVVHPMDGPHLCHGPNRSEVPSAAAGTCCTVRAPSLVLIWVSCRDGGRGVSMAERPPNIMFVLMDQERRLGSSGKSNAAMRDSTAPTLHRQGVREHRSGSTTTIDEAVS